MARQTPDSTKAQGLGISGRLWNRGAGSLLWAVGLAAAGLLAYAGLAGGEWRRVLSNGAML